jgi:1-acyl-sn-glycerol-3-phosphate acyltransferase
MLYLLIATLLSPAARWGRLHVEGRERVPEEGPVLVVPNHDSQWDPVMVGVALRRRRLLRFLARANLFGMPVVGRLLRGMRQIPIERGAGDRQALGAAEEALNSGEAVCIFPEGKLSNGEQLRARSGVGWLARGCPEARIVLCAVTGTTDYVRFPRRPRVTMSFFEPAGGQLRPEEEPGELAERLLGELRQQVPPAVAGRKARPGALAPGAPAS